MSTFDLVIFDCDGVLVDSERITNQVLCTMLNELGLRVSLRDMFEHFVGLSMSQCVELITDMYGRPPPFTFVEDLRRRASSALKEQVTPIPGVVEVLADLRIPYCVSSNGAHEKIRLVLDATGLLKYFEGRIFSAKDAENPKPEPDIFLFAAHRFGARPSACAVVEDTPTGVRAGITAGMYTLGFAANTPAHRLCEAGAHEVLSEMRLLPGLLLNATRKGIRRDRPELRDGTSDQRSR